jgi:hypothetical protein
MRYMFLIKTILTGREIHRVLRRRGSHISRQSAFMCVQETTVDCSVIFGCFRETTADCSLIFRCFRETAVDCSVTFACVRKTTVDCSVIFACVRETTVDCSVIFACFRETNVDSSVIFPCIWNTNLLVGQFTCRCSLFLAFHVQLIRTHWPIYSVVIRSIVAPFLSSMTTLGSSALYRRMVRYLSRYSREYGLGGRSSILGSGKKLSSSPHCPGRFWGTPSLLSNGHRGHRGRDVKLTTNINLIQRSSMVERHVHSPYVFMSRWLTN